LEEDGRDAEGSAVTDGDGFEAFVAAFDRRLWQALVPSVGADRARDAATDAFVYAWRHWDRIATMANREGYVYTAARGYARQRPRPLALFPAVEPAELPHVEPALIPALAELSEMQRTVVYLVEGCGWGLTDTARLLDISVSTVRNHLARAMARLRAALEVPTDA
jgi:DNA-directed RNA polymerase specialized sigma24 family protein